MVTDDGVKAATIQATESDAGKRVDVLLVERVPGMSRAKARALAEQGKIRVGGRRVRKGALVRAGDVVTLDALPTPADFDATPDPVLGAALAVVHEDAHIVVVDKPAGVPAHPLRPGEVGTVAGALVARYPELAGVGYRRREPGILHRLDTDTSGLMLAARDATTFERLRLALRAGLIEKRYVALVEGALGAPRTITLPLATDPTDERRVRACVDERDTVRLGARDAITRVLVAEPVGSSFTYVTVEAPVAGRHQIRVHFAAIGHPLAGDRLYGGPALEGLTRHFLHAVELSLVHPVTGKRLCLRAPLPPELARALEQARV
jgi:23S rRNA pseudouridine1911/1915/1917 synthase